MLDLLRRSGSTATVRTALGSNCGWDGARLKVTRTVTPSGSPATSPPPGSPAHSTRSHSRRSFIVQGSMTPRFVRTGLARLHSLALGAGEASAGTSLPRTTGSSAFGRFALAEGAGGALGPADGATLSGVELATLDTATSVAMTIAKRPA